MPALPPLTSEHFRAARQVLGWSQERLAAVAGISVTEVAAIESGDWQGAVSAILRRALETGGIRFLEQEGAVVLRKTAPDDGLRPDELNASNDD